MEGVFNPTSSSAVVYVIYTPAFICLLPGLVAVIYAVFVLWRDRTIYIAAVKRIGTEIRSKCRSSDADDNNSDFRQPFLSKINRPMRSLSENSGVSFER